MIESLLALTGVIVIVAIAGALRFNHFIAEDEPDDPLLTLDRLGEVITAVLLASLVAIRLGIFNRWLPVVFIVAAALVFSPARFGARAEWPESRTIGVLVAVMMLVGSLLRNDPVYFLGDWTDFGEYVNRGNLIADGGGPGAFFPPITETYVAFGHLVFSERYAMAVIPLLALLTAPFIAAIIFQLTDSTIGSLVGLSLYLLHPVAVWFGRLPTSEVGYGLLSVIFLYQLSRTTRDRTKWMMALTVAALVLSRLNGFFLVLSFPAVIVAATLAGEDRIRWIRTIPPFCLGWFVGFLWLWRFDLLSSTIATLTGQFGPDTEALVRRLSDTEGLVVVLSAILALAVGLVVLAREMPVRSWAAPTATALVMASSAAVIIGGGRLEVVRDGFSSLGTLTLALGLFGGAALLYRTFDWGVTVALLAPLVIWTVTFAFQFDEPENHYVYLYWDRYLYPYTTLVVFILAGAAAAVAERGFEQLGLPPLRWLLLGIPLFAITTFIPQYRLQHDQAYHGADLYEHLQSVADQLPPEAAVAYYGVPSDQIWSTHFFFFPNTYRVVARPLAATFGVSFANLPDGPTDPDPIAGIPPSTTHSIQVSLVPISSEPPSVGTAIPISLLPRFAETVEDWDQWMLHVIVREL